MTFRRAFTYYALLCSLLSVNFLFFPRAQNQPTLHAEELWTYQDEASLNENNNEETREFSGTLRGLAVSQDGESVTLSYYNIAEIIVLDGTTGKLKRKLIAPRPLDVTDIAWSPTGEQLAVSSANLFIWQLQPDTSLSPIQVDDVDRFSWSLEGVLSVSSNYNHRDELRFIDGLTGSELAEARTAVGLVSSRWSPDGRWIALYKSNPPGDAIPTLPFQIDVWDQQDNETTIVNLPFDGEFRMTPGDNFLWLPDSSGLIGFVNGTNLWRWRIGADEAEIISAGSAIDPINPPPAIQLSINARGDLLATRDLTASKIHILNATNGKLLLTLDGFAISPTLFAWGGDAMLYIYDGVVHAYHISAQ